MDYPGNGGWKNVYHSIGAIPKSDFKDEFNVWGENEHPRLAAMALQELGVGPLYGAGSPLFQVIDLNASIERPYLLKLGTETIEKPRSLLEERALPQPYNFSGLPDYDYTLYDWINKSATCPVTFTGSAAADPSCHNFKGWMGALNSSHFGTQAAIWYRRLHNLATNLAVNARTVRERLKTGTPAEWDAYRDYAHEAEDESLIVEGYAQHFLQDRWSMGHMWERWDGAEPAQLPFHDLYTNLIVGAAAGLLHGSESVLGSPDPMSSPYLNPLGQKSEKMNILGKSLRVYGWLFKDYAIPTWRLGLEAPWPGIGDHRLQDMLDHGYGREYGYDDHPLEAGHQKAMMLRCMTAGWADVIRAFGESEHGGGFGSQGAHVNGDPGSIKNDATLRHACFGPWATNRAIALGWLDVNSNLVSMANIVIVAKEANTKGVILSEIAPRTGYMQLIRRMAWPRVSWRVFRRAIVDPDGTDLAKGGIGPFGKIKTGDYYARLPSYIEPADLDTLPMRDAAKARDKWSFYGLFNRAHVAYWCQDGALEIEKLRGSKNPYRRQACQYLADRYYAGTDRSYTGVQSERRRTAQGSEIRPVCAFFGHPPDTADGEDDSLPVTLAPGYVEKPQARTKSPFTADSIVNWCDEIPLFRLAKDEKLKAEDIAVVVDDPEKPVTLWGLHLDPNSNGPGRLTVGDWLVLPKQIVEWTNSRVVFRIPKEWDLDQKDYPLSITRADGIASVGRFFLRFEPANPKVTHVIARRGSQTLYEAFTNEQVPRISERITPGSLAIQITFDRKMDQDLRPMLDLDEFGPLVHGRWLSDKVWEATQKFEDNDDFKKLTGRRTLTITATSKYGMQVDSDPAKDGDQPDTRNALRFGPRMAIQERLDLTGCWWGDTDFSSVQIVDPGNGTLTATAYIGSVYTGGKSGQKIAFEGTYTPPDVTLWHTLTAKELATLPWFKDAGYTASEIALLVSRHVAFRLRLKPYGGQTYGGTRAVSALAGSTQYQDWTIRGSNELEENRAWSAQRLTQYEGGMLEGVAATRNDYTTPVHQIDIDTPLWFTARGKNGCPVKQERIFLELSWQGGQQIIPLNETGKDTNIYRSQAKGVQVDVAPNAPMRNLLGAIADHTEAQTFVLTVNTPQQLIGQATPKIGTPPSVPRGAGLNYYRGQEQGYLASQEAQLRDFRRQLAEARQRGDTVTVAAMTQAVRGMEAMLEKSRKSMAATDTMLSTQATAAAIAKLTPEQWQIKLCRDQKSYTMLAETVRDKAAHAKDADSRRELEREASAYEGLSRRMAMTLQTYESEHPKLKKTGGKCDTLLARTKNVVLPPVSPSSAAQ